MTTPLERWQERNARKGQHLAPTTQPTKDSHPMSNVNIIPKVDYIAPFQALPEGFAAYTSDTQALKITIEPMGFHDMPAGQVVFMFPGKDVSPEAIAEGIKSGALVLAEQYSNEMVRLASHETPRDAAA